MNHSKPSSDPNGEQRGRRRPAIIDVGGIVETTRGNGPNVRENQAVDPPDYTYASARSDGEVDLEGR